MEQLTHYRKVFNRKYLGAEDMPVGTDLIATISHVNEEIVIGDGGKKDKRNVVFFQGIEKGMVLNVTNSKSITYLAKTSHVQKWPGVSIQIFATTIMDRTSKKPIEVLRIRDVAPRVQINTLPAMDRLRACKSLSELQNTYLSLSVQEQNSPQIQNLKDQLKGSLR